MIFFFLALSLARAPFQAPAPIPAGHARVLVHFVDENGVPVPNVDARFVVGDLVARSDLDGRLAVDVPCDRKYGVAQVWIEARAFGYAKIYTSIEDVSQGREHDFGRIVLAPGGAITGRVVDADGRPVAGAQAVAYDRGDSGAPGSLACEQPDEKLLAGGTTGTGGEYRIEGVPVGRAHVWIQHDSAWACWSPDPVEVREREVTRMPDVALAARPSEYRIEGAVLDEYGSPIQGVEVSTTGFFPRSSPCLTHSRSTKAITDADGGFVLHLRQVFDGGHYLSIRGGDGYASESVPGVPAGTRGLIVRLSRSHTFELAVTSSAGVRIERFGWDLVIDSTTYSWAELVHDGGRATIEVRDQPFELVVSATGYATKSLGRFEPEDVPAVLDVVLEPTSIVSGDTGTSR